MLEIQINMSSRMLVCNRAGFTSTPHVKSSGVRARGDSAGSLTRGEDAVVWSRRNYIEKKEINGNNNRTDTFTRMSIKSPLGNCRLVSVMNLCLLLLYL